MPPASADSYRAPAWLPGGHAQTIWPLLCKGPCRACSANAGTPRRRLHRPRLAAPHPAPRWWCSFTGWKAPAAPLRPQPDAPLAAIGWNGVVPHFRGCSGEPNRQPRAYHAGDADEIELDPRPPRRPPPGRPALRRRRLLGGNALLCGSAPAARPPAGTSTPPPRLRPLDLAAMGHHLTRGFNRSIPATSSPPSRTAPSPSCVPPRAVRPRRGAAGAQPARVRQPRHRPAARLS
jgi:hypothetical protein